MSNDILHQGLDLLVDRVRSTLDQVGSRYPYMADPTTGIWQTDDKPEWCAGDWIHMLWMAHDLSGEPRFREAARELAEPWKTAPLKRSIFEGMIRYRIGSCCFPLSGEPWQRNLSMEAARFLLSTLHPLAGQIPVGSEASVKASGEEVEFNHDDHVHSDTTVAIDTIYVALLPLWDAAEQSGDPRLTEAALSHVDQTLKWFVSPQGGTIQLIRFDPNSGDPLWGFNLQGCHRIHGCWSRGQAWCIAGLSLAYEYTGLERYADAMDHLLEFHFAHSSFHGIPPYDYLAPAAETVELDSSAAAIIISGLLRQHQGRGDPGRKQSYVDQGRALAALLIEHCLTKAEDPIPGRLLDGCFFQPIQSAPRHELIWGSYHLMEALHRHVQNS
jgi:unsaturated chondroitin disaccharide hydrolase